MDCFSQKDGSTLLAFGSEQGNIFLRKDWEELPKLFSLEKSEETKIMDLKFSPLGTILITITIEKNQKYKIILFRKLKGKDTFKIVYTMYDFIILKLNSSVNGVVT